MSTLSSAASARFTPGSRRLRRFSVSNGQLFRSDLALYGFVRSNMIPTNHDSPLRSITTAEIFVIGATSSSSCITLMHRGSLDMGSVSARFLEFGNGGGIAVNTAGTEFVHLDAFRLEFASHLAIHLLIVDDRSLNISPWTQTNISPYARNTTYSLSNGFSIQGIGHVVLDPSAGRPIRDYD